MDPHPPMPSLPSVIAAAPSLTTSNASKPKKGKDDTANAVARFPGKTSKYTGVTFRPTRVKYQARIYKGNKEYNLGLFDVSADAALAYDAAHRLVRNVSKNPGKEMEFLKEYEKQKDFVDWVDMDDQASKDTADDPDKLNFLVPSDFHTAREKELMDRLVTPDSGDDSKKIPGPHPSLEELKLVIRKESIRIARVVIGVAEAGGPSSSKRKKGGGKNKAASSEQDEKKLAKKRKTSKDGDNASSKSPSKKGESSLKKNSVIKAYEKDDNYYDSTGLGKPVPNPPKNKAKKKKNPFGPPPVVPVGPAARKALQMKKSGGGEASKKKDGKPKKASTKAASGAARGDSKDAEVGVGHGSSNVVQKDSVTEGKSSGGSGGGTGNLSPGRKQMMDAFQQHQNGDFQGGDATKMMMSQEMMNNFGIPMNGSGNMSNNLIGAFFGSMQGNNGNVMQGGNFGMGQDFNGYMNQQVFNQGMRGVGGMKDFDANFAAHGGGGGEEGGMGSAKGSGSYGKYGGMPDDFRCGKRDPFSMMGGPGGGGGGSGMGGGMFDESAEFQRMMLARSMGQGDDTRGNAMKQKMDAMKQMGNFWQQGAMQGMDNMPGTNQGNFFVDGYNEQNMKSLMQGGGKGGPPTGSQFQRQMGRSLSPSKLNMFRAAGNDFGNSGHPPSSQGQEKNAYDLMRSQMGYDSGMHSDGPRLRDSLLSSQRGSNALERNYGDSNDSGLAEKIQNFMQGEGNSGGYSQHDGRAGNFGQSNYSNFPSNASGAGGSGVGVGGSGGGGGYSSGGRFDDMAQLFAMGGSSYPSSRDQGRSGDQQPPAWGNQMDRSFGGNFNNNFQGM